MLKSYVCVAGLTFSVENNLFDVPFFDHYKPFRVAETDEASLLFRMVFRKLIPLKKDPSRTFHTEKGDYCVLIDENSIFITYRLIGSEREYRLRTDRNWSRIQVDIGMTDFWDCVALDDFILFSFIYSAAFYQTVLVHASCVKYGKEGVAFMGPSGIGKSTHSQLWLKYIPDTILLNDDQPAIRLVEGKAYIFGTPWSGKTACYIDDQAHLKAIFMMEQGTDNESRPLSSLEFFQQLLQSCSLIKEDEQTFSEITNTLSGIVKDVKAFHLKNKPEKEAVALSYKNSFG